MLLTTGRADIVDFVDDDRVDVTEVLGGRGTADIDGGGDNGFLETVAQLAGERLTGDAYGDGAVAGNKVRGEIDGSVEDKGGGTGVAADKAVDELPGYIGDMTDIALQTGIAVDKADEGLGVVALFDGVDTAHGIGIGGVAADTPHGVGGIENDSTAAHHLNGVSDILFLGHFT